MGYLKKRFLVSSIVSILLALLLPVVSFASSGGYSPDHGELSEYTPPQVKSGAGKKLMAIYMVGSDLESRGNAGTIDFYELIQGYLALSSADAVEVIVAFGGADKDGWRGMKFANMAQIISDSEDEEFGNETGAGSYLYQADGAHMGDESSLKLFLQYVQEGFVDFDQRFITFWDHGGSYYGFGNDDNFDGDPLSLEEIDNALTQSNVGTFDLIGFDACLMGAMEVAHTVVNHAAYLIASEETEPGHGWNWTAVIQAFNDNPSIVNVAKAMIDNFVKDVHGEYADGKTLSVLKLENYNDVKDQIDTVASALAAALEQEGEERTAVVQASTQVRDYGKQDKNDARVSIDVKHLAQLALAKSNDVDLKNKLLSLIDAVDAFVVHSKHDGTRPNSFGVTMAPPEKESSVTERYWDQGFAQFQTAYQNVVQGDTQAPVVEEQNDDSNADDLEWEDENYTTEEYAGDDPYFQEWIYELEDELWAAYDAGELSDDELDQELAALEDLTEDDPDYQEWLQGAVDEGGDDDYFGDWNDEEWDDEGGNDFYSKSELMLQKKYPFLTGERAAFVYVNPTVSRSSVSAMATNFSGVKGISAKFSDPNLTSVVTTYGNIMSFEVDEDGIEDDWFLTIGTVQAYPTSVNGQYFTPQWNQNWYFMVYDENEVEAYMPMYFESNIKIAGKVFAVYTCEIDYQDSAVDYASMDFEEDFDGNPVEYASMELIVSPNNRIVDHSIKTYQFMSSGPDDEEGYILYDKMTRKLKVGDKVRFYSLGINLTRVGYDSWFDESGLFMIAQEPTFMVDFLEFEDEDGELLQYYYSMLGEDVAGNTAMTEAAPAVFDTPTSVSDWSLY